MTEKIQMTEEQAREFYNRNTEVFQTSQAGFISAIRSNGYILKSELQQKVEEAEEMYKLFNSHECNYSVIQIIEKQNEAVQLLKQSHPEFKGE